MAYKPTPREVTSGRTHVPVSDRRTEDLLQAVLLELKKISAHLEILTEQNSEDITEDVTN